MLSAFLIVYRIEGSINKTKLKDPYLMKQQSITNSTSFSKLLSEFHLKQCIFVCEVKHYLILLYINFF